jgi:hypothetical protein
MGCKNNQNYVETSWIRVLREGGCMWRNYLTNISHTWQICAKESLIELDHHQKESSDTVQKTQNRRSVDIEVSGSREFWYISWQALDQRIHLVFVGHQLTIAVQLLEKLQQIFKVFSDCVAQQYHSQRFNLQMRKLSKQNFHSSVLKKKNWRKIFDWFQFLLNNKLTQLNSITPAWEIICKVYSSLLSLTTRSK